MHETISLDFSNPSFKISHVFATKNTGQLGGLALGASRGAHPTVRLDSFLKLGGNLSSVGKKPSEIYSGKLTCSP